MLKAIDTLLFSGGANGQEDTLICGRRDAAGYCLGMLAILPVNISIQLPTLEPSPPSPPSPSSLPTSDNSTSFSTQIRHISSSSHLRKLSSFGKYNYYCVFKISSFVFFRSSTIHTIQTVLRIYRFTL